MLQTYTLSNPPAGVQIMYHVPQPTTPEGQGGCYWEYQEPCTAAGRNANLTNMDACHHLSGEGKSGCRCELGRIFVQGFGCLKWPVANYNTSEAVTTCIYDTWVNHRHCGCSLAREVSVVYWNCVTKNATSPGTSPHLSMYDQSDVIAYEAY